ncbi:MAG: tetratricopeptide repeat protein [Chitinophagaceae bacterium]|nr:tetratricopeptide repeat protein [Chitinophagaceae bacterium]
MKKMIGFLLITLSLSCGVFAQENNFITEGIKMHDKGDYEGAIQFYKKALQSDKNSIQANYELASSYLAIKNYANTLKYADKVIARNLDYVDQAYILKGSALDLLGRKPEAINTYRLALKKYKTNHLLYYNLALTSFNIKNYKEAEDALQKALKLNPLHASSHFLLGMTMISQGKRTQAVLALYNFLLLEPKTKRSASALLALEDEWKNAGKQKAGSKTVPAEKEADEFGTVSLMMDMLEAAKMNETNKNKPAITLFAENTNTIFTILGEAKKDKKGFWWNFYVDYFYTLANNHHTEALCYYITQSRGDTYNVWLKDNLPKMEALSEWYTKYMHKF